MTHLKVIIRVRPLSQRETENGSMPVIEIQNKNTVAITNIKVPEANAGDSRQRVRRFTFDCCFPEDATQDDIFSKVEEVVSKAIKRRYHSCVLAYGQSSTGKTHTMMGFPHDPGLTPRLSQKIFDYLQETAVGNEIENMKTTVSYLEIYNEKVRDLLVSEDGQHKQIRTLRVREHPKKGPYVQGLTEHQVRHPQDLIKWIRLGNEHRRVASTLSNLHSSRSHSVVTITCDGVRLYLVDLAGSERAGSKFFTTSRFREGANINRSLVALGNVISALGVEIRDEDGTWMMTAIDQNGSVPFYRTEARIVSAEQPIRHKSVRRRFVPYRDSVLTWLLKDTLGGNSNTVMIATISPSSGCYSETVNTLRFGQRAKLIISCPVVNEDPKEKIIRELRTEVAKLRELLKEFQVRPYGYMLEDIPSQPHETKIVPSFIPLGRNQSECSSFSAIDNIDVCQEQLENNEDTHVGYLEEFKDFQETTQLQTSTDQLIPVMNVQTSVSTEKKQIPKFRRTASVDFVAIMDRSRTPSFGSHESLPTTKPPTVGSKILPKSSLTQKPLINSRTLSTSNPLIRRRSVDKPSSLKSLLSRRSIPESPKKQEKSVETEASKTPIKPRVDSHRKVTPKPRSDIVANVTRRLYLKANNKDAGTDMEGFDEPKNEVPKELSICSNARLRLKEITQKALRAHRFKQVETQTETVVLRVKEISTDVQDLRQCIPEVKHVETYTVQQESVDASVGCSLLDNFNNADSNCFMKVTKTCSVQCSEDMFPPKENIETIPKREPSPSRVSFTKYLQGHMAPLQPSIECVSPSISNPIYANSVNINVSHHYLNGKRVGSLSDDSLEDQSSGNMLFPTPDLISNHNSLDPNIHATQNEQPRSTIRELKTQYALEIMEDEFQICVEEFESEKPKEELAKVYHIANIEEEIHSISLPICAYVTEICSSEKFQMCSSLHTPQVNFAKALMIDYRDPICYETVTIFEPTVLKSCVKISPNIPDGGRPSDCSSHLDQDAVDFQEIPDSLEYHKANNTKRVRFSPKKSKNGDNMFEAMAAFLKEATILMNNITEASKHFEMPSNSSSLQDFDLQITLDDISNIEKIFESKRKKHVCESHSVSQMQTQTNSRVLSQSSTQTSIPELASHSTQYDDFSVPVNKFDALLEDCCSKLEYKLNKKVPRKYVTTAEEYSPFNSLNSFNPSCSGFSDINEEFSLESHPLSYSDYGSLKRPKMVQRRKSGCNPSAFLRQLTNMRKQIIQSSREDLDKGNS